MIGGRFLFVGGGASANATIEKLQKQSSATSYFHLFYKDSRSRSDSKF